MLSRVGFAPPGAGWRDATRPLPTRMPAPARRWIRLSRSMTQALAARFGPDIEVVLHAGGCGRLAPDEARLLGTRRRHGQVREVRLRAGRTGLLAARTVYVSRRLRTHPTLVGLGSRPLGELLFVGVRPRRKQRQYARRVPVRIQPEGRPGAVGRRCCWARRTVYLYERQRLLVTEIFLPAMLR